MHEGIRLRTVTECDIKGAYLIEPKEYGLAAILPARIPNPELKTYYYNRVTIYREPKVCKKLAMAVDRYPDL